MIQFNTHRLCAVSHGYQIKPIPLQFIFILLPSILLLHWNICCIRKDFYSCPIELIMYQQIIEFSKAGHTHLQPQSESSIITAHHQSSLFKKVIHAVHIRLPFHSVFLPLFAADCYHSLSQFKRIAMSGNSSDSQGKYIRSRIVISIWNAYVWVTQNHLFLAALAHAWFYC